MNDFQQVTLRVPGAVVGRIDHLAEAAGLTRAQVLRLLLVKASAEELPIGLVENADALQATRGIA